MFRVWLAAAPVLWLLFTKYWEDPDVLVAIGLGGWLDDRWLLQCVEFGSEPLSGLEEAICRELNELEARADRVPSLTEPIETEYEETMGVWRKLYKAEQPTCRLRWLGQWLRMRASELPEIPEVEGQWDFDCGVLVQEMLSPQASRCFAAWYFPRRFGPEFFTWPDYEHSGEAQRLFADPEYEHEYAAAGDLSPPFGAPQVDWHLDWSGTRAMRSIRALDLWRFRNMRGVFPQLRLSEVPQVWDFGAGTGDFAAMLRDLGYRGTYFSYDLPQILLFTCYWLRYAGLPAHLGADLLPHPDAARNGIVLESSSAETDGDTIFSHLDRGQLQQSIFVGFGSLSETSAEKQRKVRPWLKEFGFIMLAFTDTQVGVGSNNAVLMRELAEELRVTHDVFVWDANFSNDFVRQQHDPWRYLAAGHRAIGGATCAPPSSCSPETLLSGY